MPLAWIFPALLMVTPSSAITTPDGSGINGQRAAPAALMAVALGKEIVAFLMVAVPVVAPMVKVVAALPIERLVAIGVEDSSTGFICS